MIDLHTHSLLSDGAYLPAELVRRAEAAGYEAIAVTDHVDHSNVRWVTEGIVDFARAMAGKTGIRVIPGAEITHVPPELIGELAARLRGMGAQIVVVHGETRVEPVAEGTNLMALKSDIDILAHPGLLSDEEAMLAAERGIYIEISGRKGHSFTNGHVQKMAQKHGAPLVLNSDAHTGADLFDEHLWESVALGAGLGVDEAAVCVKNSERLVEKALNSHP